jgi:MYXO-CTERM domain-containing protein
MISRLFGAAAFFVLALASTLSRAATYEVGPGKEYATIQETLGLLGPGDVVEVQGDHTYPGDLWFRPEQSGTREKPVTVRGIRVNDRRPVIEGIGTEQWHDMIVLFYANHFVFEGFEIVGDGNPDHFGLVHKADNVTLRDLVVHDVGGQGLLGTDSESGSLTLESSEFYRNGEGLYNHQIYAATDETMYPGSVFRMQFCYVHDGAGGNNVKSRAERNEIYFNWIEGAVYHELDLIGPDGQDPQLAREDSDVVGNVLVKHSEWRIARIGGDGTGNTAGRYRFVNNTMVLSESSDVAIGLQQTVETLELHNNVILRTGGGGAEVWDHNEPEGPAPRIFGSNNWIQRGFTKIPESFTGTISGDDPGFTDMGKMDVRPAEGSPLLDQGASATSIADPPFPKPLLLPTHVPPSRELATEAERPTDASADIGAFELGSGTTPGDGNVGGGGPNSPSGGSGGDDFTGDEARGGGCGCRVAEVPSSSAAGLLLLLGLALRRLTRRARG